MKNIFLCVTNGVSFSLDTTWWFPSKGEFIEFEGSFYKIEGQVLNTEDGAPFKFLVTFYAQTISK